MLSPVREAKQVDIENWMDYSDKQQHQIYIFQTVPRLNKERAAICEDVKKK